MAKKTTLGSAKRFGVRYGRSNKEKVAVLEKSARGKHKCPFCNYVKVRRVSRGIWECEKCLVKFSGRTYDFQAPKSISIKAPVEDKEKIEETTEEVEEQVEEEDS